MIQNSKSIEFSEKGNQPARRKRLGQQSTPSQPGASTQIAALSQSASLLHFLLFNFLSDIIFL